MVAAIAMTEPSGGSDPAIRAGSNEIRKELIGRDLGQ